MWCRVCIYILTKIRSTYITLNEKKKIKFIQIIIWRRQKVWHFSLLFFTFGHHFYVILCYDERSFVRFGTPTLFHHVYIQIWNLPFHFNIWNYIDINFIIITNCLYRLGNFLQSIYLLYLPQKNDSGAIQSSKWNKKKIKKHLEFH